MTPAGSVSVIVVDDSPAKIGKILEAVEANYPGAGTPVWPEVVASGARTRMMDALDEILTAVLIRPEFNPFQRQVVVIYDLQLNKEDTAGKSGIDALKSYLTGALSQCCNIVLSAHVHRAKAELSASPIDAFADNTTEEWVGQETASAFLGELITSALVSRAGRSRPLAPPPREQATQLIGSPEMENAEVALGRNALATFFETTLTDWRSARVVALTGGYSGAFVFRAEGFEAWNRGTGSSPVSTVLKLAPTAAPLAAAKKCAERALRDNCWKHLVVPPINEPKPMQQHHREGGWYVSYAALEEPNLERALHEDPEPWKVAEQVVAQLGKTLQASAKHCVLGVDAKATLSCRRRSRFEAGMPSLRNLIGGCRTTLAEVGVDHEKLLRFATLQAATAGAGQIRTHSAADEPSAVCSQHGDLHLRNTFLENGSLKLIDWDNFGQRSLGTDLATLEFHAAVRLMDGLNAADAFPNRLDVWIREWRSPTTSAEAIETSVADDRPVRLAGFFIHQLRQLQDRVVAASSIDGSSTAGVPPAIAVRTIERARLAVALEMVTYEDLSWFKRLFLLVCAHEIATHSQSK